MQYEVTTGLTPQEAVEQTTTYFGRGGVGGYTPSRRPRNT